MHRKILLSGFKFLGIRIRPHLNMVSLNPQVPFVLGNGMESQLGELFHGAVCPS